MNALWRALGYETQQDQANQFTNNNTVTTTDNVSSTSPDTLNSAVSFKPQPRKLPTLRLHNEGTNSNNNTSSPPQQRCANILQSDPMLLEELSSASLISGNPDFSQDWTMMFSTNEHGRSFPRFVSAVAKVKGPTLIIIQEEDTQQMLCNVSGNIFGCVTFTPWENVKTREMNAKAASAATARSERTGVAMKSMAQYSTTKIGDHDAAGHKKEALPPQAPQFFGGSECFVFKREIPFFGSTTEDSKRQKEEESTDDDQNDTKTVENDEEENVVSNIKIFNPRPTSSSLANRNFMYFFDTHPDGNSVGIGFGGNGARSCIGNEAGMCFFVDRSLSRGQSCTGGCPTFQYCNEQLCRNGDGKYKIKSIEVWALNPESIEKDYYFQHQDNNRRENNGNNGNTEDDEFASPALADPKHAVAKAMYELNGGKLWSENNDREDV